MIPRPQTPPEATINPTGGAGAANASTIHTIALAAFSLVVAFPAMVALKTWMES